ncbi:MAG: hypothetical protein U1F60_06160 [Planctomycetota bacterium]
MSNQPWDLGTYRLRRKVLKVFGASFHVYDGERIVAFCNQKAFKLREDIRLFADEAQTRELLWIRARQIVDFSACFDVVDSQTQQKVGALRRRGFKSILRDSWEVLDADDKPLGKVEEDSAAMALFRRFLSNLVPQKFHLQTASRTCANLKQRWNPFVYSLDVTVPTDCPVDRRLVFASAVLIAAIEGRQQ